MVVIDCYIAADIINGMIALQEPSYLPARWITTLVMIATILFVSAFNVVAASQLSICEGIFATCHFFAFVPVALGLLLLAPNRSASEVFLSFTDNGGGWPSLSLSILVGQMSNIFVVLGGDGVAHLAEEIEDAGMILPQAMVWTYAINAPLGILTVIVFCFSILSVEEAVTSTTAPVVNVFDQTFRNPQVTMAFSAVLLCLIIMIAIAAVASCSRQTFAFARDKGLPYSDFLATVDKQFEVPANAILVTAGFAVLVSIVNLGSLVALEAFMSLTIVAFMATYLISIGCVALKRMRKEPLPSARWSLGKYGLVINLIALVYASWAFFWCFWPRTYHVDVTTFNWACLMFSALCTFALLMYWYHARSIYEGPVTYLKMAPEER